MGSLYLKLFTELWPTLPAKYRYTYCGLSFEIYNTVAQNVHTYINRFNALPPKDTLIFLIERELNAKS